MTVPPAGSMQPQQPEREDQAPPPELTRASNLATLIAALLVFLTVLNVTQIGDQVRNAKKIVAESAPDLAGDVSDNMIRSVLIISMVMTAAIAIGFGLTAHSLRERKSWARPVGFTFGGILMALSVLSLGTGSTGLPLLVLGLIALWVVLLLTRPAVRDYLKPRADAALPPYPPPPPPPPHR